ncbi:hypothetical protein [Pleomorphomonas sp. PLEO]|uniref:hypothetical protein n=1 Tax=Pleomorphomonas sp. PLEO TaxID=3239306 RepID=UPI00351DC799
MTGPSWAWLTTTALMAPFLTVTAHAGDSGAIFRSVAVRECTATWRDAICLGAPLVSGSATTALDVLRDVYPGLGADGTGKQFAGAEAVESASDPDAGDPADRAVNIEDYGDRSEIAVIEGGKAAYAAVVSSGVVAVAQIRPDYRPLGRLQVATDPGGPTIGYRLLLAAPDSPVVVTDSSHFNSQEGFDSLHLVGVVGGRLVDLYDGPYLYSLAEETEHCETLDHREAVPSLEIRKQGHHGLADFGIAVDYTATCINGEKRKLVKKKSFRLRLIYDGTRYDGDSGALDDFNSTFTE